MLKFTKANEPANIASSALLPAGRHICMIESVSFDPAKVIKWTKNGMQQQDTAPEFAFTFECIDPSSQFNSMQRKMWVRIGGSDKAKDFAMRTIYSIIKCIWSALGQQYPDLDPSDAANLGAVMYAAPISVLVSVDEFQSKRKGEQVLAIDWLGFEQISMADSQRLVAKYGATMMPGYGSSHVAGTQTDTPSADAFDDNDVPF